MLKEEKNAIIKEYAQHEGDTGSPEVQIALLTKDVYKRQMLACLGFNWEDMTSWQAVGNVLLQAVQSPVIVVLSLIHI